MMSPSEYVHTRYLEQYSSPHRPSYISALSMSVWHEQKFHIALRAEPGEGKTIADPNSCLQRVHSHATYKNCDFRIARANICSRCALVPGLVENSNSPSELSKKREATFPARATFQFVHYPAPESSNGPKRAPQSTAETIPAHNQQKNSTGHPKSDIYLACASLQPYLLSGANECPAQMGSSSASTQRHSE